MAKRHLGLGQAKAKKQKTAEEVPSNEITVELNQETDANDELAQLKALWKTYLISKKENELVVNGIIHECDRLLRNSKIGGEKDGVELDAGFYAIYALALAELANFNAAEHVKVVEFFDAAIERVDLGLEHFADSVELLFTKSKILIDQVPLQYISQVEIDSEVGDHPEMGGLLDIALKAFEVAESKAISLGKYDLFDNEHLEILETVDDVLDIVDNFGKEDDEEDVDEEDDEENELSEKHPLYSIQNTDKYNKWWREHTIKYLDSVDKELLRLNKVNIENKQETKKETKEGAEETKGDETIEEQVDENTNALLLLRRNICQRIGQSYLQEAEFPASVFTSLTYDEEFQDAPNLSGLSKEGSQKAAQDLISTALVHLKSARDEEDPETWVHIAEATISLGNLYELESEKQLELYKEAEGILYKANNATNGRYKDILENLLEA